MYREWTAESVIPVASTEGGRDTAFSLQPGETFTAVTGNVHVTGIERVIVMRPTWEVRSMQGGHRFEPGDTLFVLDYVGEGFFNAWFDGEVYQPEQFWTPQAWDSAGSADGYSIGSSETEWWIQVRSSSGRTGWFRAGPDTRIGGADACA